MSDLGRDGTFGAQPQKSPPGSRVFFKTTSVDSAGRRLCATLDHRAHRGHRSPCGSRGTSPPSRRCEACSAPAVCVGATLAIPSVRDPIVQRECLDDARDEIAPSPWCGCASRTVRDALTWL